MWTHSNLQPKNRTFLRLLIWLSLRIPSDWRFWKDLPALQNRIRDVAQPGSALRSGRRGRWFKSSHPDSGAKATFLWLLPSPKEIISGISQSEEKHSCWGVLVDLTKPFNK